jgi:hypothetical protein
MTESTTETTSSSCHPSHNHIRNLQAILFNREADHLMRIHAKFVLERNALDVIWKPPQSCDIGKKAACQYERNYTLCLISSGKSKIIKTIKRQKQG